MPMLREELADFVLTWNAHYIRKQRNRPHVVPGQPWSLYFQPEAQQVQNFAEVIPHERLQTLQDIFEGDRIDLNAYLPADTISVCESLMQDEGAQPVDTPDRPKLSLYLLLRSRLSEYIASGRDPQVGLLESPTGGLNRVRDHLASCDIDTDLLLVQMENGDEEIDLSGVGW